MEAVEALVLVVWYELMLSVAMEAVDIGQTAPPEMDPVEMREAGHASDAVDVPAFPVCL